MGTSFIGLCAAAVQSELSQPRNCEAHSQQLLFQAATGVQKQTVAFSDQLLDRWRRGRYVLLVSAAEIWHRLFLPVPT